MKFNILEDFYEGDPLESGKTSIPGSAAPPVKWLFDHDFIAQDAVVLDYGAGKFARNADFLREKGIRVWAYDPYNYNGSDGWAIGSVSDTLPDDENFDIAFTCYVLNILSKKDEKSVLERCSFLAEKQFHIVRNQDVIDMVKKALKREDKYVYPFFINKYKGDPNNITEKEIIKFCKFGTQTVKGFQRLTVLEELELIKSTSGWDIYGQ